MKQKSKIFLLLLSLSYLTLLGQQQPNTTRPWSSVTITASDFSSFKTTIYGNPFSGSYRSILDIAPELTERDGIRLPVDKDGNMKAITIKFTLDKKAKILLGVTPIKGAEATSISQLEQINFNKGVASNKPIIENGVSITELPALDVYTVSYTQGEHEITIPSGLNYQVIILGTVSSSQKLSFRDVKLANASDYPAFYIDGFAEHKPLFTIVGGSDKPIVDSNTIGTENIRGGFEAGSAVKVNGTYHMFPTERTGEPNMPAYHDRVKTRIGHWTSRDAINWTRQTPILESSGVYAIVPEDNPMNDRRSAIWSFNVVFNEENDRWYGYYLAYTTDKEVEPNHSFGRIWRCESVVKGIEGIGGPYRDMGIIMEPGLDTQLWEGRQGVASFYPFKIDNEWHAFISGAYPFDTRADYPLYGGSKNKAWHVGLAKSKTMEGPWTRMGEDINPLVSIHPTFVENPIVSKLPNGVYIAMFDGGPDYLKLPNKIAYTLSKDGINWSSARYLAIDSYINKWWMVMRTPLCLIPEGDDVYTIIYTAWVKDEGNENPHAKTRFNPIGMVKVKLDRDVLDKTCNELFH